MTICSSAPHKLAELYDEPTALESGGIGALTAGGSNLPLRRLAIRSRVSGVHCQTTIAQVFASPHRDFVEATYIFPLPGRFAVTACTMHVGGRTIEAQLQDRAQARATYNQAIAAGHRAAIAEEERSETFTLRVGNIPPREEVTVELTLIGNINVDHGEGTLRLPLVVAPRYVPGQELDGPSVGMGTAHDTNEAPDASRVTPPTLLAGFPNPVHVSLEVDLDPGANTCDPNWRSSIRSSLHSVFVSETTPVKIKLLPGERLNRDFILRFPVLPTATHGVAEYAVGKDKALGTFAVTIFPPAGCEAKQQPRDVVFVLDRSGSMNGWKIVAARRALARMIDTLRADDRFRVIAFDNEITTPHAKGTDFQIADDRQRWQAAEWIAKIDARGGTELGGALRAALQPFATFGMSADRDAVVVLITDGQVAGEDSVLRTIEALRLPRMPRIFTLGIDRSVNASLLTRLADLGGGAFELVESEQRLDQVLERVHQQIAPPILTSVTIEPLEGEFIATTFTPANNRHVFADRPLTVLGRCGADPKCLRMRVTARDASGGTWQQEITAERTNSTMLLPLWGRGRVRELEVQYARNGDQQLQTQIIAISLESHILSRFTAYVAVDRAEVVNKGGVQEQIVQPVEQPEGWDESQVFHSAFEHVSYHALCMPAAAVPGTVAGAVRRRAAATPPDETKPRKKSRGFFGFFRSSGDEDAAAAQTLPAAAQPPNGASFDDSRFAVDDDSGDSLLQEFTDTAIDFTENKSTAASPSSAQNSKRQIPDEIIELVPESVARENQLIPVAEKEGKLVVWMSNPSDQETVEKLRFILNREIEVQSASAQDIQEAIDTHYAPREGEGHSGDSILQEFVDTAIDFTESQSTKRVSAEPIDDSSPPLVRLVNLMFEEAVQQGASHIVIAPEATQLSIQYLVEDQLQRRDAPPLRLHAALVSRLRILANALGTGTLQQGVVNVTFRAIDVNIRLVFIPTPDGMAIVMRLLRPGETTPARPTWPELLAPWLKQIALADPARAQQMFAFLCGD